MQVYRFANSFEGRNDTWMHRYHCRWFDEQATRERECTQGPSPEKRQKGPQGRTEDAVEFNCMPQTETIGGGRPPPSINENLPSPDCFKEPRSHDSC